MHFTKKKWGSKKKFSLAPLAKLSPDFQNRGTALDNNNGVNSQSVRCVGLIKADDAVSYGGEFGMKGVLAGPCGLHTITLKEAKKGNNESRVDNVGENFLLQN